jgi:hypothetical protein
VRIKRWVAAIGVALAGTLAAGQAAAQTPGAARPIAVEGVLGSVAFADDATIRSTAFGGRVRVPLLERLSVGPEVMYLVGDGDHRDLFVLGSMWLDFFRTTPRTRVVPFLSIAAGYIRHSERFGAQRFVSGDPVIEGGGGVRVQVAPHVHIGGEVRIGSELHLHTTGHLGVTWPRR